MEQHTLEKPTAEGEYITSGLDYYKATMSQQAFEREPDAEVTFTFHNRGDQRLLDYVSADALQQRFDERREHGWDDAELAYFRSLHNAAGERVFSEDFLGHLKTGELPPVRIGYDEHSDDITIETTGPWSLATFWETVVMSDLNELYFENFVAAHGLSWDELYDEGDRRLSEKIALLQANPGIKIADFGTRRHFSLAWQKQVLGRLRQECPSNLIGTSNIALARTEGLKPIGTFAHELPMVYAGLAHARGLDVKQSHNRMLQDWHDRYGDDLAIALTDTFGSKFFFSDFTSEQAQTWRGVRHDSGDPYEFGENLIKFYQDHRIDPRTKTVVFSDGLDIDTICKLYRHFEDRITMVFGWGTTLMNDLGVKPLNIVMKATHVRDGATGCEADTVKVSDSPGKHTGPLGLVALYKTIFRS